MRLEFVMILIRKGAIGVFSMAMLTLQGAWSQLKICADQTACPRLARLSLEPLLAAEGRPSSGPLCSHQTGAAEEPSRTTTDTLCPEIWVQGSAAPVWRILVGEWKPDKKNPSVHNQTSVRKCHTPHSIPPKRAFIFKGTGPAWFSLTLWVRNATFN